MATFNLFTDESPYRYVVEVENRNGGRTVVKETNNYLSAVDTCNFWDERVNTYMHDRDAVMLYETVQERIDRRCDALMAGINWALDTSYALR